MNCLKCGGDLELLDSDDRIEWYSETYKCRNCGQLHERLQTRQPQSSLVKSDELYMIDEHGKRIEEDDLIEQLANLLGLWRVELEKLNNALQFEQAVDLRALIKARRDTLKRYADQLEAVLTSKPLPPLP